jgi:RNA polymerase sigma factor (sigma-70 family)
VPSTAEPRNRSVSEVSDEGLMMLVKGGETQRLGLLFERHHARLYQFCLRMTGSTALAEDLVQDVFTRMLRYAHTFRADSQFLPWAYRLARNATNDHFRKHRHEPPMPEETIPQADDSPGAQERLVEAETSALLRRALLELPEDKREVLVLSRFHSLKYQEIAELLECSEGAVKVRVHRAVKQLRESYEALVASSQSPGGGRGALGVV